MIRTLLGAVALIAVAIPATAQTYGSKDLAAIKDAAANNEARFNRDYKGKTFTARLRFKGTSSGWHQRDVFFVEGVRCNQYKTPDEGKALIAKTIDYKSGQPLQVTGTIDDTFLGELLLNACTWSQP